MVFLLSNPALIVLVYTSNTIRKVAAFSLCRGGQCYLMHWIEQHSKSLMEVLNWKVIPCDKSYTSVFVCWWVLRTGQEPHHHKYKSRALPVTCILWLLLDSSASRSAAAVLLFTVMLSCCCLSFISLFGCFLFFVHGLLHFWVWDWYRTALLLHFPL